MFSRLGDLDSRSRLGLRRAHVLVVELHVVDVVDVVVVVKEAKAVLRVGDGARSSKLTYKGGAALRICNESVSAKAATYEFQARQAAGVQGMVLWDVNLGMAHRHTMFCEEAFYPLWKGWCPMVMMMMMMGSTTPRA